MGQKAEKTKVNLIRVGSGNFISQIFFLWMFRFIPVIRRTKDLKDLQLALRRTETANYNDDILDRRWKEELALANKENRYVNFKPYLLNLIKNILYSIEF
jgi:hypothetical protein